MTSFAYASGPARVVFGPGVLERLPDEVRRLGRHRALVISGAGTADVAERAAATLGPLLAGHFAGAAMHTPADVTAEALELTRALDADCLVSVGGGSATGLGKALSVRTGLPQIAVPTTYAGSEVTPVPVAPGDVHLPDRRGQAVTDVVETGVLIVGSGPAAKPRRLHAWLVEVPGAALRRNLARS